jgi:Ca2+:H+ antiporter
MKQDGMRAASNKMKISGVALAIPTVYEHSVRATGVVGTSLISEGDLTQNVLTISRIVAILLIVAYAVYVFFQARTHNGIYTTVFQHDENRDADKHRDLQKDKLTLTECVVALAVGIALVTLIAIALVKEIEPLVHDQGISDPFMGLILVPLVEKFAEHLTAIDEAWDNQMNFALSHVLGATLQTALFNAPLVAVVAWGLDKDFAFAFQIFDIAMLLLAVITVAGFLRDQKSNYLEGCLSVMVYIAIAVAAYYYPNPHDIEKLAGDSAGEGSSGH